MTAPNAEHIPSALGGDLGEKQRIAYEEGHDADIPSNESAAAPAHSKAETNEALTNVNEAEVSKEGQDGSDEASDHVSPVDGDIEKQLPSDEEADATKEAQDPNIVDWDGPDDPQNPQNWSQRKKWSNVAVLSFLTFLIPLASSMFAPGVPEVDKDFNNKNESLATFVVSVYILGFAMGPLVIAPLSEIYGRAIVYNVTNVFFFAWTIGCALAPNMGALIAFRFLAGCFGVAAITIGGGTIADMMPPEQRGGAMSVWAIGPLFGPVIGPVAGGFLASAKGWRWVFWVLAMAVAAAGIFCFFVASESYAPVLLERKTKRLRKETGNPNLVSKLDLGITPKELWKRSLVRPAKLMFLSVICALMSLYMAIVYGILYLLFTTFTFVFERDYGLSGNIVGLTFIGVGIGALLGLVVLGATSDRLLKHLAKKHNGGKPKPEYRLPPLMWAGPLVPAGLFLYGWTVQYRVQWAVPLLGTLFVGFGMLAAFMCITTYLIDAYPRYAASAMGANTVLRSIFGAVFPLFALQMYGTLGQGWGNSLVGFVGVALIPIPFVFYYYGERIRTHPKLQVTL